MPALKYRLTEPTLRWCIVVIYNDPMGILVKGDNSGSGNSRNGLLNQGTICKVTKLYKCIMYVARQCYTLMQLNASLLHVLSCPQLQLLVNVIY